MWGAIVCAVMSASASIYAADEQRKASEGHAKKPSVERYIGPDREAMNSQLQRSSMYGTALLLAGVISFGYMIAEIVGLVP